MADSRTSKGLYPAYTPFDSLIDALSRHLRRLPEHEAAALLPREVHALARLFPALSRVSVVACAPTREIPDPHESQRRAFDAFAELIARMRDRQPLVLHIDDLQWTDRDSVRFARHLLLRPEPSPILLLASYRSERSESNPLLASIVEAAGDNHDLSLRTLELGPLSDDTCTALAHRLLGLPAEQPMAELARAVAAEAGGSPFFAQALAHAARHSGGSALSLSEALSAQVAALGDGAQRILQAFAYAGQPLPARVVLNALQLRDGYAAIDALCGERLLRVSSGRDDTERLLDCYHDKVREHVSAALLPRVARELAIGLARALSEWPLADPELLTRCLEDAGERQGAGELAATAAESALEQLAFDRAARLFDRALELATFDLERANSPAALLRFGMNGDGRLEDEQGALSGLYSP